MQGLLHEQMTWHCQLIKTKPPSCVIFHPFIMLCFSINFPLRKESKSGNKKYSSNPFGFVLINCQMIISTTNKDLNIKWQQFVLQPVLSFRYCVCVCMCVSGSDLMKNSQKENKLFFCLAKKGFPIFIEKKHNKKNRFPFNIFRFVSVLIFEVILWGQFSR